MTVGAHTAYVTGRQVPAASDIVRRHQRLCHHQVASCCQQRDDAMQSLPATDCLTWKVLAYLLVVTTWYLLEEIMSRLRNNIFLAVFVLTYPFADGFFLVL